MYFKYIFQISFISITTTRETRLIADAKERKGMPRNNNTKHLSTPVP